ncbi:MAG TPA: amino acid adenylation domain-containing protein, partial [Longimicrobium sp.]|nr:amino acid adenylation domain-containing protein [Longimicrobium sp.]
ASVHVVPEEVRADPPALRDWLVEHAITVSFIPTPVAEPLLALEWPADAALRWMLTGGDRLRARPRAGMPFALANNYGPTECTVVATSGVVEAEGARAPSIGGPIENTRVYVLDAGLRPLPVGVPGELCIGGAQVARGYLNRPALTAERFVPDPFSSTPGARLYRSGDKVRWLADGTIEYLGRLDEQVKVRGFRIELGEVEAVLRREPGVADCVVVAREDAGQKRLVAYVVGGADAESLRASMRRSLPEYMVPAAFVALDALPLTPNGKLDRKALPAPDPGAAAGAYLAPRTPAEEVLCGILADLLRVERVGVRDNFFALGGHSLLATRVVSRIRETFGVELPLRALFDGATVAELAGLVDGLREAALPPLPTVVPVERTGALPLSFAQERLWFLDQLEAGGASYNIPAGVRISGALDAGALERALGEIVRRHETLRTVLPRVNGVPAQVVVPFAGFALPAEDVQAGDDAAREAHVRRRAAEEGARPFDLAAGPLFRASLLRLADDEHVLLLCMHHVVSDGWSMGVLFRELSSLYAAFAGGADSPLPALPVQYADFAVWQHQHLRGDALERQLAYWRGQLAGAPALLELPADRPRPAVQSYRGAQQSVVLSAGLLARLQALGRREGATLYMVLLGAFQVLLSRYAGTADVVVGSPIAGRTRHEVEELIGFFVNLLVLRTDLSGTPDFREVLRRVRRATLGAYEHQDVPFEKLVAELAPERSLSHAPLFQVLFTVQEGDGAGLDVPGLRTAPVEAELRTTKFDLSLLLRTDAHGIHGTLEYGTDLFDGPTIQRMLRHLERVLEQVAEHADRPVAELDLLDGDERRQVVQGWNRTDAAYPADACIHHLFEAQAARTPDAVAVRFEGASLSYRALNERANRLAHHLAGLAVGPETRVGVCLERSVEMVVSLLAVLKAGGGYVPLDPGYPADRLAFMLADSGVAVLLTQASLRGTLALPEGAQVLEVDAEWPRIAGACAENPRSGVGPSNLAYVIYTSGSTGRPKGVMNAHGGVVNRLWWMQAEYGIGADDVVLQKTPFSFDVSVWEFFWPLQQGATLVVARPDGHRDPGYLQDVIGAAGVTTLHFVPSMLQQFVETADAGRCTSLRRVLCSGEALPPALVEAFHARWPRPVELHNLYGPTEAAVDVSYWACERVAPVAVVPIGRPVWNTQLYVLEGGMRPLPVGIPGELFIGGVQVARGYLGRAGLTADRFVPDPLGGVPGARMYRTGDRARWLADGTLEYLGRLDGQVKVRGFRIELGEIEAVLRREPGVADCAVLVREDAPGDRRIVAYVTGNVEADALRAALRGGLPEYMVPSAFVAMDVLPLTPNGKLDRKALPAPEFGAADAYVAPRTVTEEVLAGIISELLRVDRV